MFRLNSLRFYCAVAIAWFGVMSVNAQAETPPEILRRIEARCDRHKAVDFKWKVVSRFTEHYGKRVRSDPFGNGERPESSEKLPATFEWTGHLHCNGSKLRLSYNPPVWSFPDSRIATIPRVAVSDGTETRLLSVHDSHTQGIITEGQGLACLGYDYHFVPLITHFRTSQYPVQSLWPNPDLSGNVSVGEGEWDDHACVVIRWSHRARFRNQARVLPDFALWLDPRADYAVRRFTSTRGDQLRCDIRIELAQYQGSWLPRRWQWHDYHTPGGELLATHNAEVVDVRLNQPVDHSALELKFPRATSVSDQRVNPPRWLLIGNEQREFEVTPQQTSKAESLEALLEKLEGRKEPGEG